MGRSALAESLDLGVEPDTINEALVLYTGHGRSPFPRARGRDVLVRFGEAEGAAMIERIAGLMEELQLPLADGDKRSRKSVTERAIAQLATRHPELDEAGLKALAFSFSFGLR